MFQELKPNEFRKALPLFQGFDYSLSILAAIEGNNPGRIFVDDINLPRTAFGLTVEGYLLAGEHDNPATNEALIQFFSEKIFTGQVFVNGDESMSLAVYPQTWETRLPELIPMYEIEKNRRYYYQCRKVKFDWRKAIPEGYQVCRVDQDLLNDPKIVFPDVIRDWFDIEEMWWRVDNFLSKGVSYCVLRGQEVVAWCTPDCVAGKRIDVGIITHPEHRQRGLASLAVAATVDHCLNQGFAAIGWHCNAENVSSWKTAEKVGFERKSEYFYYYYMYDPIDHLAEMGWYHYRHREYDQTVKYYEWVFAQREQNPDYYYHLTASAWALLGNKQQALKYLHAAVEHGWAEAGWTKGQEEFEFLHSDPEWETILRQMESLAKD